MAITLHIDAPADLAATEWECIHSQPIDDDAILDTRDAHGTVTAWAQSQPEPTPRGVFRVRVTDDDTGIEVYRSPELWVSSDDPTAHDIAREVAGDADGITIDARPDGTVILGASGARLAIAGCTLPECSDLPWEGYDSTASTIALRGDGSAEVIDEDYRYCETAGDLRDRITEWITAQR